MAETSQKTILQNVSIKNAAGELDSPAIIGASFEDIIDTREDKTPYTLAQFYDAFMDYISNTDMFYYGETQPVNSHMKIWIDESETNQDNL